MSFKSNSVRKTALSAALSAALIAAGVFAASQAMAFGQGGGAQVQQVQPQMSPEQEQLITEFQQVQQELQQTQQQLGSLEEQAYQQNSELNAKREQLRDAITEKMSSGDYDAEAEFNDLQATVEQYQQPGAEPSQEEIQAFQERQQEFEMRQQQAFEDQQVQQLAAELRDDVRQEMVNIDPSAEQLFVQLEVKQRELEQLRERAMNMGGFMQR